MKATLEFNLPEEQTEFNRVNQSLDMACALFDILQLRKSLERKYESIDNIDNTDNSVFDGINEMANEIYNVLEKHNINIDNLIE
jgi:hypothetical protein